jgi:2-C-methyl-D-erythritol 4-phosphate cytidylyltransferase
MSDTTTTPKYWGLIPTAGTGSRAGGPGPKQYQSVAGLPMVRHTLIAFATVPRITSTLVVVAPGDNFLQPTPQEAWSVADCGGATRAASVTNGLEALRAQGADLDDWVLVHDAARCLITPTQINALIDACGDDAVGGLLALKLPDTLKQQSPGGAHEARVASTLTRDDKWLAQTPQMFRLGLLHKALLSAGSQVTDESSAIEAMGLSPKLVSGSAQNFKVTYPEDFALAEAVLTARRSRT